MSESIEDRFQTLHEIVKAARIKLNRDVWDYLVGGSETETTLARNRLALDSLAFRPRVLRDVSQIDTSASLFGKPLRIPVLMAPVGALQLFEPGGGGSVGAAASTFGNGMMVSSGTLPKLETTAQKAGAGPEDFSALHPRRRRLLRRSFPPRDRFGLRRAVPHRRYSISEPARARHRQALWPGQARRPRLRFSNPPELARRRPFQGEIPRAVHPQGHRHRRGRDARAGARHRMHLRFQPWRPPTRPRPRFDGGPAGNRRRGWRARKIIVDGSISRGTDVVKAIALGADAVAIGRLYVYGLAAEGSAGIVRVLEILEEEIHICLGLLGVTSFAALDKSYVCAAKPVVAPHAHSAFPLLDLPDY